MHVAWIIFDRFYTTTIATIIFLNYGNVAQVYLSCAAAFPLKQKCFLNAEASYKNNIGKILLMNKKIKKTKFSGRHELYA